MGALALLLTACSSDGGGEETGAGDKKPVTQLPKDSAPYWVNPQGSAAKALADYREDGDDKNAGLVEEIAQQPVAEWLTNPDDAEADARRVTEGAAKDGRDALLVAYNIPHRDCGLHSAGGAADGDAYRAWTDSMVKGIGDRQATVILEPDAVLHLVDGCTDGQYHEERTQLLSESIEKLAGLKNTKVYLDAGNAGAGSPDDFYEPLKASGVDKADGFAVNVSNYYTTEDSIAYGKELSAKLGNKPFVIDTSRNGNGPYTKGDPAERWCNPPGRALGEKPTTKTDDELVDAYLWVKRPGESDGECKGGPKAGQWWPEYALGLVKAAEK